MCKLILRRLLNFASEDSESKIRPCSQSYKIHSLSETIQQLDVHYEKASVVRNFGPLFCKFLCTCQTKRKTFTRFRRKDVKILRFHFTLRILLQRLCTCGLHFAIYMCARRNREDTHIRARWQFYTILVPTCEKRLLA